MPEIHRLYELDAGVRPPALTVLTDLASFRRRRAAAVLAGAVGAVVLALSATLLVTSWSDGPAPDPVRPPRATPTGTGLTAEQVKEAAGLPAVLEMADPRLSAVFYDACTSTCREPLDHFKALEVSDGEDTTLFALEGDDLATPFGDQVLVGDLWRGSGTDWRLFDAAGTVTPLRWVDAVLPQPPAADWPPSGLVGFHGLRIVDLADHTIRPVVPASVEREDLVWQIEEPGLLWGFTPTAVIWRRDDGTFGRYRFGRPDSVHPVSRPEAGEMAVHTVKVLPSGGYRMYLHVSLDRGATWQRHPVAGADEAEDLLAQLQ